MFPYFCIFFIPDTEAITFHKKGYVMFVLFFVKLRKLLIMYMIWDISVNTDGCLVLESAMIYQYIGFL